MTSVDTKPVDRNEATLILASKLGELGRVHDWLVGLANKHAISADVLWAMDLCLEEAASNVIRHGYAGAAGHTVTIRFLAAAAPPAPGDAAPRDRFELLVEDNAPPFNPLEFPEPPTPATIEEARVGGRGIQLLRNFSDSLDYQRLPQGNRLRIVFLAERPKLAVD